MQKPHNKKMESKKNIIRTHISAIKSSFLWFRWSLGNAQNKKGTTKKHKNHKKQNAQNA